MKGLWRLHWRELLREASRAVRLEADFLIGTRNPIECLLAPSYTRSCLRLHVATCGTMADASSFLRLNRHADRLRPGYG